MSTQLALISDPGSGRPTAPAPRTAPRHTGDRRARSRRPGPGQIGWLDRRTIETGRQGVAEARAALAEANRRASDREVERHRRRDEQLALLADRSRHPAGRRAA